MLPIIMSFVLPIYQFGLANIQFMLFDRNNWIKEALEQACKDY